MAYTPELTTAASCTLRRLAWAAGLPMTKVINQVFEFLPEFMDKQIVCGACKDTTRCEICGFGMVENQDEGPFTFKDRKIVFKDPADEFS